MRVQRLAALLLHGVELHVALHQRGALRGEMMRVRRRGRAGSESNGESDVVRVGGRGGAAEGEGRASGAPGAMPTSTSHFWSGEAR